jgi:hypothetical protein
MATLTNTSPHPLVLIGLTIQPGEVVENFDDEYAAELKEGLFAKANWLKIESDEPELAPVEHKAKAK